MTDYYDRVYFRLQGTAPDFSPVDLVKKIWWFEDGHWDPPGFSARGNSYITLTEQNDDTLPNINLFEVTVGPLDPLLVVDRGFVVQKDISAGGFISSNQGELWLGSGRNDQVDVPKLILGNASASRLGGGGLYSIPPVPSGETFPTGIKGKVAIRTDWWNGNPPYTLYKHNGSTWSPMGPTSDFEGNFDTLYLRQQLNIGGEWTVTTPGNLDLGNLTVHGKIQTGGPDLIIDGQHVQITKWNGLEVIIGISRSNDSSLVIGYNGTDNKAYMQICGDPAYSGLVIHDGGYVTADYLGCYYLYFYDAMDDLTLAKQLRSKTVTMNGVEQEVVDSESASFLLKEKTTESEKDYYDLGKTSGFLLGCVKALLMCMEALESKFQK